MKSRRLQDLDIEKESHWYYEKAAKSCVAALNGRGINAYYAANRYEAKAKVMEMIPRGATIGLGDSLTLLQIGLIAELENGSAHEVFDPFYERHERPLNSHFQDWLRTCRRALIADVFLTGANAITRDGKLVSTDSLGNRVGGLIFGSRKVIVVVGANKITKNLDDALKRIKEVAAPKVTKWHGLKHHWKEDSIPPCGIAGVCPGGDCRSPFRVCNFTVIVEGDSWKYQEHEGEKRLNVVVVAEELGF